MDLDEIQSVGSDDRSRQSSLASLADDLTKRNSYTHRLGLDRALENLHNHNQGATAADSQFLSTAAAVATGTASGFGSFRVPIPSEDKHKHLASLIEAGGAEEEEEEEAKAAQQAADAPILQARIQIPAESERDRRQWIKQQSTSRRRRRSSSRPSSLSGVEDYRASRESSLVRDGNGHDDDNSDASSVVSNGSSVVSTSSRLSISSTPEGTSWRQLLKHQNVRSSDRAASVSGVPLSSSSSLRRNSSSSSLSATAGAGAWGGYRMNRDSSSSSLVSEASAALLRWCAVCDKEFTRLRRPHRCRRCMEGVCAPCSPARLPLPGSDSPDLKRTCKLCAQGSTAEPPPVDPLVVAATQWPTTAPRVSRGITSGGRRHASRHQRSASFSGGTRAPFGVLTQAIPPAVPIGMVAVSQAIDAGRGAVDGEEEREGGDSSSGGVVEGDEGRGSADGLTARVAPGESAAEEADDFEGEGLAAGVPTVADSAAGSVEEDTGVDLPGEGETAEAEKVPLVETSMGGPFAGRASTADADAGTPNAGAAATPRRGLFGLGFLFGRPSSKANREVPTGESDRQVPAVDRETPARVAGAAPQDASTGPPAPAVDLAVSAAGIGDGATPIVVSADANAPAQGSDVGVRVSPAARSSVADKSSGDDPAAVAGACSGDESPPQVASGDTPSSAPPSAVAGLDGEVTVASSAHGRDSPRAVESAAAAETGAGARGSMAASRDDEPSGEMTEEAAVASAAAAVSETPAAAESLALLDADGVAATESYAKSPEAEAVHVAAADAAAAETGAGVPPIQQPVTAVASETAPSEASGDYLPAIAVSGTNGSAAVAAAADDGDRNSVPAAVSVMGTPGEEPTLTGDVSNCASPVLAAAVPVPVAPEKEGSIPAGTEAGDPMPRAPGDAMARSGDRWDPESVAPAAITARPDGGDAPRDPPLEDASAVAVHADVNAGDTPLGTVGRVDPEGGDTPLTASETAADVAAAAGATGTSGSDLLAGGNDTGAEAPIPDVTAAAAAVAPEASGLNSSPTSVPGGAPVLGASCSTPAVAASVEAPPPMTSGSMADADEDSSSIARVQLVTPEDDLLEERVVGGAAAPPSSASAGEGRLLSAGSVVLPPVDGNVPAAAVVDPVIDDTTVVDDTVVIDNTAVVEGTAVVKDKPTVDPAVEDTAVVEDKPVVQYNATVEDTAMVEDIPMVQEESSVEDTAVVEDKPVVADKPMVNNTAVPVDKPVIDGTVVVEDKPVVADKRVVEDKPVVDDLPVAADTSAGEDTPMVEDKPVADGKVVADTLMSGDRPVVSDMSVSTNTVLPDDTLLVEGTPVIDKQVLEVTPVVEDMPVAEDMPSAGSSRATAHQALSVGAAAAGAASAAIEVTADTQGERENQESTAVTAAAEVSPAAEVVNTTPPITEADARGPAAASRPTEPSALMGGGRRETESESVNSPAVVLVHEPEQVESNFLRRVHDVLAAPAAPETAMGTEAEANGAPDHAEGEVRADLAALAAAERAKAAASVDPSPTPVLDYRQAVGKVQLGGGCSTPSSLDDGEGGHLFAPAAGVDDAPLDCSGMAAAAPAVDLGDESPLPSPTGSTDDGAVALPVEATPTDAAVPPVVDEKGEQEVAAVAAGAKPEAAAAPPVALFAAQAASPPAFAAPVDDKEEAREDGVLDTVKGEDDALAVDAAAAVSVEVLGSKREGIASGIVAELDHGRHSGPPATCPGDLHKGAEQQQQQQPQAVEGRHIGKMETEWEEEDGRASAETRSSSPPAVKPRVATDELPATLSEAVQPPRCPPSPAPSATLYPTEESILVVAATEAAASSVRLSRASAGAVDSRRETRAARFGSAGGRRRSLAAGASTPATRTSASGEGDWLDEILMDLLRRSCCIVDDTA